MREITLHAARMNLRDLVDDAVKGEATIITRNGKRAAVIVSVDEWQRLKDVPSFGRLLMSAPLEPGDIAPRSRSSGSGIDFDA
jgi:prevent-host-death family protein